jgi:WD40 repeat protein
VKRIPLAGWVLLVSAPALSLEGAAEAKPDRGAAEWSSARVAPLRVLGDPAFRHAGTITHVAPLPGGTNVLTSARDGTVRLWSLATGAEIRRFYHPDGEDVWSVCPLPGEREFLSCGEDKKVTRWNLDAGKIVKTYEHESTVFRAALLPGTNVFAATDAKGVCALWNLDTGERIRSLKQGQDRSLYTVMVVPGEQQIATAGSSGDLLFWDLATGGVLNALKLGLGDIFTLAPSPDRSQFAICSEKNALAIGEGPTGRILATHVLPKGSRCAAWSADGGLLAADCDDNTLYLLDRKGQKPDRVIPLAGDTQWGVSFSSDNEEILCGCENTVFRFSVKTGNQGFPRPDSPPGLGDILKLALDSARHVLFYTNEGKGLHVRDAETGTFEATWLPDEKIKCLALSRKGDRVLAGGEHGDVWLLDSRTGKMLKTFEQGAEVSFVGFLKDDARAVIEGGRGALAVLDLDTGNRIRTLQQSRGTAHPLAVAPDGVGVVVHNDKAVFVWNTDTGRTVGGLTTAQDPSGCALGPTDGRSLVAMVSTNLYFWPAPRPKDGFSAPDDIRALVSRLGAATYREREAATQRLMGGGEEVLRFIDALEPSTDPEVEARKRTVCAGIAKGIQLNDQPFILTLKTALGSFAFHPDGTHWAAACGSDAEAEILLGIVRDGRLEVECKVKDGHSPRIVLFDDQGARLYAGNRDGTISVYGLRPEH